MSQTQTTHEQKTFAQGLPVHVDDLKRLYYDAVGCASLSFEEIAQIQDKAKHVHASVDSHYYKNREELIENYYKRFGLMQKLLHDMKVQHDTEHVSRKILLLHRFNLDYGTLYLHYYAFLPALELLASEEQAKKWLPLAREL